MISFADYRPPPEARESYGDQVVNAAVAAAEGTAADAAIATIEAASRLWEGAFSAGVSAELAAWQLGLIGRSLLTRGESVWWRSRGSGFYAAADWDVMGDSPSPARWTYRLSLPAPKGTITRHATAETVLHVRIGASARQPWRGCSPLVSSRASRAVLENVERSLNDEHKSPVGHLIGVADPDTQTEAVEAIAALGGKTILVESNETGLVDNGGHGKSNDWQPRRVGPEPDEQTISARESVERSLLAAASVPVELVTPTSGSDAREALRRFLFIAIKPAANRVSAELRRLGLDPEIDFSGLNAADVAGKARAYGQLRAAEVPDEEARRLTGLE